MSWFGPSTALRSPPLALQDLHPPFKSSLHQQKLWGSKASMEVWHESAERLDNRNGTRISAVLIYVECWWVWAGITSTVKAKGEATLAKLRSILQTHLGPSSSAPWSSDWWTYNFLTQEPLEFANSNLRDGESTTATAQPHQRLVSIDFDLQRQTLWLSAQHPLSKYGRQKPKIPHTACCTIHLRVFKSYQLTTRRMLCWWQMRSLQALATHLLSPWVRRTLTLWSSPALLQ